MEKSSENHAGDTRRPRTKSESKPKFDDRTTTVTTPSGGVDSDAQHVINILRNPKRRPIEVDAREFRVFTEKMMTDPNPHKVTDPMDVKLNGDNHGKGGGGKEEAALPYTNGTTVVVENGQRKSRRERYEQEEAHVKNAKKSETKISTIREFIRNKN